MKVLLQSKLRRRMTSIQNKIKFSLWFELDTQMWIMLTQCEKCHSQKSGIWFPLTSQLHLDDPKQFSIDLFIIPIGLAAFWPYMLTSAGLPSSGHCNTLETIWCFLIISCWLWCMGLCCGHHNIFNLAKINITGWSFFRTCSHPPKVLDPVKYFGSSMHHLVKFWDDVCVCANGLVKKVTGNSSSYQHDFSFFVIVPNIIILA